MAITIERRSGFSNYARLALFSITLVSGCKCGTHRVSGQSLLTTQSTSIPQSMPTTVSIARISPIQSPASTLLKAHFESWRKTFLKTLPDQSAIIIDPSQGNRAVSEGFGYGLLLSLYFNDRASFDAILKGYQKNTQSRGDGLSAWLMDSKGNITSRDNAIDADIDVAWALLEAGIKWPGSNYKTSALKIIASIGEKALVKVNGKTYLLPSSEAYDFTKGEDFILNPSYFNFLAFKEFAEVDPSHNWMGIINASYEIIDKCLAKFGFVPDWIGVNSKTGKVFELTKSYCRNNNLFSSNQRVHIFGNDAVRVLWHLSFDYKATGESRARTALSKILSKATPSGTEVEDAWADKCWHNEISAAAYALIASTISYPNYDQYVSELKTFEKPDYYGTWEGAKNFYFNQSIVLLMHLSILK
jgi:endoglucanase